MEKGIMRFILAMAMMGFGLVGLAQGAERPIINISLISAPFGTGSYVISGALEDISKKFHPWLRITHSESPGFVFNVKKLEKRATT